MTLPGDCKYFLNGADLPLERYMYVEVLEIAADRNTREVFDSSSDGFTKKESDAIYFWSIYLRQTPDEQGFRSMECVADLPTRQSAELIANGLRAAITALAYH